MCPPASEEGLKLISDLLLYPPRKRPAAQQCLKYAFFDLQQTGGPIPKTKPPVKPPQVTQQTSFQKPPKNDSFEQIPIEKPEKISNEPKTPDSDDIDAFFSSIPTKPKQKKSFEDLKKHAAPPKFKQAPLSHELSSASSSRVSSKYGSDEFIPKKKQNTKNNSGPFENPPKSTILNKSPQKKIITPKQHYLRNSRYFPGSNKIKKSSENTNNRHNINNRKPDIFADLGNTHHQTSYSKFAPKKHQNTNLEKSNSNSSRGSLWSKAPNEVQYKKVPSNSNSKNQLFSPERSPIINNRTNSPFAHVTSDHTDNELDTLLGISKIGNFSGNKNKYGFQNGSKMTTTNNMFNRNANSQLDRYPPTNSNFNNNNLKFPKLPNNGDSNNRWFKNYKVKNENNNNKGSGVGRRLNLL